MPSATCVRGWRRSAGAVSADLVVATPVLLALIMSVVHFALWQHAEHVADEAAQAGLAAARVAGGTDAAGTGAARAALGQLGNSIIIDPHISITRTSELVRVEVSGRAQPVVPFIELPVNVVVQGPAEKFRPAGTAP